MKLEHIAIWVNDLELVKNFYVKYFKMICSKKYINSEKRFTSYFLSFNETTTRIEIMHRPDIKSIQKKHHSSLGLTHFSISVGGKIKVDYLTEVLRKDGFKIAGEPRITGDGYYESVVEDCEGNWVEITE